MPVSVLIGQKSHVSLAFWGTREKKLTALEYDVNDEMIKNKILKLK